MKIIPLGDRILLEPLSEEKKTKGGIVLPESIEKEKPEKAKVAAVGPGRLLESGKHSPMSVKKGDVVLFTKYGPNEIKVNDKEYLIAKEEDILAILE
ncbi:MAG: co-chaperone GroES [Parcubacteria group bacterium]|nr:co-chaperone GroES [Parcubacteria group bacterium]